MHNTNNSALRSISPTPRSMLNKPALLSDSHSSSFSLQTLRRHLTNGEKQTLQNMTVDEKDIELLREFMEKYHGNLKVKVVPHSHISHT